ncbi:SDR family oxidoreductase [Phenylobacterium deserti]|uniref:Short chain dehydrogenase n=1 Tax=Phenylobacterium deserti TaxID=1914756 RepID=A0A328AHN2_9CAUL|nr:SDR family oxidoreductase [Phenylobacterium deserti]RAK52874.1 short chain dehydrogenase [Phenylobacterium deserti]
MLQTNRPAIQPRPLRLPAGIDPEGAVVVILGGSSGLGRAAAVAFAREGAHVVVAARRSELLEEVRQECEALGPSALAVTADATDAGQVKALAQAAIARFGRIDVWINNVGIGAVGAFEETPIEAHEQVLKANLLGHIHGAHAVVPHFKARGRGVLINTNSLGAFAPAPYAVAYSASKFGLRGYSEALRGELAPWPGIRVCDVFPTFLDTPGVSHGANYVGRELKPLPLVYDPRRVAKAMVGLARKPQNARVLGFTASLIRLGHFLAPGPVVWAMGRYMEAWFKVAPRAPISDGAVFRPMAEGAEIHGGWKKPELRAAAGVAIVGLAAVLSVAALRRRS